MGRRCNGRVSGWFQWGVAAACAAPSASGIGLGHVLSLAKCEGDSLAVVIVGQDERFRPTL